MVPTMPSVEEWNRKYHNLLPVARWLLSLLCTHKCAKPPPQVPGMLYPAVSVGS